MALIPWKNSLNITPVKTLIPITMWALLLLAGCAVPTVEASDSEDTQ